MRRDNLANTDAGLALATIAVVLERRTTDFADEYLCHLARLKLAEMPLSIRVARECLKHRARSLTRNQIKTDQYKNPADPLTDEDFKAQPFPYRASPTRKASVPNRKYDEVGAC